MNFILNFIFAAFFTRAAVLILTLGVIFPSHAQQTVRITNGEWAPYLSEKLPEYGTVSHLVTEAFEQQNIDVEYGFFPWPRALENAKQGTDWQASIVWSRSEEREPHFYYSDPVLTLRTVLFHLKNLKFEWGEADDLSGYTLGLAYGYSYGAIIDEAEQSGIIKVERQTREINNFRKLMRGRIDLLPCEYGVGHALLNTELDPEFKAAITHHPKPTKEKSYHLIVSKSTPDAEQILESFNLGLRALRASQRADEILYPQ